MILYGLVQECMVLMMIANGVLCGRSSQGCTLGGIQHGVQLVILISFDIRVRDLVVRLSIRLCLLFRISLRLITLWIYLLKGFRSGTNCVSRIDRTLASVDWVDHLGNVSKRVFP